MVRSELKEVCGTDNLEKVKALSTITQPPSTNCKATIFLFNCECTVVIDTGAACSVMTQALADKFQLSIDHSAQEILLMADGTPQVTLGKVWKVPVLIKNISFPADVLIMAGNSNDTFVLGVDWIKKHNVIIDLNNDKASIPYKNSNISWDISTQVKYCDQLVGWAKEVSLIEVTAQTNTRSSS
ncbi:Protein DDI1-like protein [Zancudomyces culisetae]|uniref:Protein DDI1-like protein n=1 Tax=Zancudomyces culisetae TaxID=1213189 RepID=A0A1R1PEL7_ZANCU|nr:Protein DDI1-like protein [Zancudomyces culisetae]|eukprot:OMH79414.1 Protein DDI1-like protein [Zancudomyces culisetae]